MRIVDEWNKGSIKVTVFHMNGRYSLKLEDDLMEQTYKFRDGQFENLQALKDHLSEGFYVEVNSIFNSMRDNRSSLDQSTEDEYQFDTII